MNVVLIPAYKPDERLIGLVEQLKGKGFENHTQSTSGRRYTLVGRLL